MAPTSRAVAHPVRCRRALRVALAVVTWCPALAAAEPPAPWTPVRVTGHDVHVWNRVVRFGTGPVPQSVVSAGEELLAEPVALTAVSGGRPITWDTPAWREKTATRAAFACEGSARAATVRAETHVEYDGLVWTRVRVAGRIERLELRVALRAEHAALFTHNVIGTEAVSSPRWSLRKTPEQQWWAGPVPDASWRRAFTPQVWIGTPSRGLAWMSESARALRLDKADTAIEIVRSDGRVTLTVRAVDHAVDLPDGYEWAFGLMPTPLRKLEDRLRHVRIVSSAAGQPESFKKRFMTPGVWAVQSPMATLRGPVTFALWARRDGGSGQVQLFGSRSQELVYDTAAKKLVATLVDDVGHKHTVAGSAEMMKGQWRHVAVSHDGRQMRLYLDGRLLAEREAPFTFAASSDLPFCLGANAWGSRRWPGALDEVCVFRRALAADETARLKAGQFRAADDKALVAHWNFESHTDGVLQSVPDQAEFVPGHTGRAVVLRGQYLQTTANTKRLTGFEYLRRQGVTHMVLWNNWSDIWGYPGVTDPQYAAFLREFLAAAHRHDIKVLPYISIGIMMQNEPDAERMRPLVAREAKPRFKRGEKRGTFVEKNTAWAKYYAERVAALAREFPIDGIYMDGAGLSAPLDTALVDGDKPEALPVRYDMLGGRELLRRIYAVFHGGMRQDGFVLTHCSSPPLCAQVGFTDVLLNGELHWWLLAFRHLIRTEGATFRDRFPPALCRGWFVGETYGVPIAFCGKHRTKRYTDGRGKWLRGALATEDELLAAAAVHGTAIWTNSALKGPALDLGPYWRARDAFGVAKARWLPYWRNANVLSVEPIDVRVSAYRRADGALLLMVVNYGQEATTARIRLAVPMKVTRAWRPLTGEPVPVESNVLCVTAPVGRLVVVETRLR